MKKLITFIIICLAFNFGFGQIVSFDFQGNVGNEATANSNFNDVVLGVSTISRGAGLIANNNANSFNSQNWSITNIADAVANDDYLEFTISAPIAGFEYDITTIDFDIQRSGTGLRGLALRSSLDGFANNIDTEMPIADMGGTQNITFNVSQLNNSIAITYRLYGFAEALGGAGRIEGPGNNIQINGFIKSINPIICSVSDNFSNATLGPEWVDGLGLGNPSIINNELSITSAGVAGLDYLYQDVSSAYNTNLASSTDIITWEFNMRESLNNTFGFGMTAAGNTRAGLAFIIGGTNSDITLGDGYAVVLGQQGNLGVDNVRLVRYTGGLDDNPNITDIITSNIGDIGNEHLSIRVVFDPNTAGGTWELFVRDDGNSFSSAISLTAADSQGTQVDNTFTSSDLNFIAAVWSHNTQNNATATFDNLCVSRTFICTTTTTWDGTAWDNGIPTLTSTAIIDGDYDTGTGSLDETSFSACSLIINTGVTLNIDNSTFVEIENNTTVDGTLTVQTMGNFIQNQDTSTFTNNGISEVLKSTPIKLDWFFYTYWSSPVSGLIVDNIFPVLPGDNMFRFGWDAANYQDVVINANGSAGADGIDDDNNAFIALAGTDALTAGIGYAITESQNLFTGPTTFQRTFSGAFNNGSINVPIFSDAATVDPINNGAHYHFLGNPYPSAINFNDFQAANPTTIGPIVYYWSQATPPNAANAGNQNVNFSQNDYAVYMVSMGTGIAGASGVIPNEFIPSGQGFFVPSTGAGTATFNNSMRASAATAGSNDIFFGIEEENNNLNTSTSTTTTNLDDTNLLWLDLTSNNGIFSQILVGYVDGATDANDGLTYDASRILPSGSTAILYTYIDGENGKLAIQGKNPNGLDENETIPLGFDTNIDANIGTTYTLSIAQFKGVFFENTSVFLKDNLLDITHDLSTSEYNFTSDTGVFLNRFEVNFTFGTLSTNDDISIAENTLAIIELENGNVQFRISDNLNMESIRIIDFTGRELYNFETSGNNNTYNLSKLNRSVYIAQIKLSNGSVISKKAIKRL